MACVSKRPPASKPELLSTRDEVDDLSDATTPEQIERIVSAWTRRAEHEADKMLAPVQALADREDKSFKRGDAPAQRLLKAPGHGFAFAARP